MVKTAQLDESTHECIINIQSILRQKRINLTISEVIRHAMRNPAKVAENIAKNISLESKKDFELKPISDDIEQNIA